MVLILQYRIVHRANIGGFDYFFDRTLGNNHMMDMGLGSRLDVVVANNTSHHTQKLQTPLLGTLGVLSLDDFLG